MTDLTTLGIVLSFDLAGFQIVAERAEGESPVNESEGCEEADERHFLIVAAATENAAKDDEQDAVNQ